jgi:hypothetical protein
MSECSSWDVDDAIKHDSTKISDLHASLSLMLAPFFSISLNLFSKNTFSIKISDMD